MHTYFLSTHYHVTIGINSIRKIHSWSGIHNSLHSTTSRHAIVIGDVLIQVGSLFLSSSYTVLLESLAKHSGFLGSRGDRSVE